MPSTKGRVSWEGLTPYGYRGVVLAMIVQAVNEARGLYGREKQEAALAWLNSADYWYWLDLLELDGEPFPTGVERWG
jgi:hypothetical protein